jgi:hypothetical protein
MTLKNVEDTKGVFKSHRSKKDRPKKKDRQSNDQRKRTKEQT